MSARVVFAPAAVAQLHAALDWWVANRPAAPALFAEETSRAIELIRAAPRVGRPVRLRRRRGVRRVLLTRTGHHLYYTYDADADVIRVAAVWAGARGKAPPVS